MFCTNPSIQGCHAISTKIRSYKKKDALWWDCEMATIKAIKSCAIEKQKEGKDIIHWGMIMWILNSV
jgi:hypothetical protein